MNMKHSGYLLVLLGALALSGCEKKETTVIPSPSGPSTSTVTKEKETVVVPGPKETVVVPGPQGPTGATGAPGEPGKPGDTTVIVTPPPPAK